MCSKRLLSARRALAAGLARDRWILPAVFLSMSAFAGSELPSVVRSLSAFAASAAARLPGFLT